MEMKKSDLKTGMLVKIKNSRGIVKVGMVLLDTRNGDIVSSRDTWFPFCNYPCTIGESTTFGSRIIEVRQPENNSDFSADYWGIAKVIWEYVEPPKVTEMTVADIETKLGVKNLKIVK